MRIYYSLKKWNDHRENSDKAFAFVPTMGALHQGHLTLVNEALKKTPNVVVSIFVNPKQFNNLADLEHYPRTIEADLKCLKAAGVMSVILPTVQEIYPLNDHYKAMAAGKMALGLEGEYRPGHFDGVVNVVDRLFHWVNPKWVFFGQKDLQQCLVIKELIDEKYKQIEFFMVPTIRESNGLAMSSRNVRLSAAGFQKAGMIFDVLTALSNRTITLSEGKSKLEKTGIEIEYLKELPQYFSNYTAWVFAGYLEGVRLIDNVLSLD